ncbi:MAG TPA: M24 family metallopeptidase [Thermoanaerobaculia bacterium]|nr:M24 family metallopeptidase [Thermoanaerobaculia bacterium]
MQPRVLTGVLRRAGADALLVVGTSSRDPDLLPFTGEARLDHCFVVARPDGARWLGYHSPIEREEAARSGLPLLDPATLRAGEPLPGGDRPGARLARSVGIALRAAKIRGRRIALGGRYPNGELTLALAGLRRQGFSFVSGHDALLRLRRPKAAAELAEMQVVAAGTAAAMRRVARVLVESEPARGTARRSTAARSRRNGGTALAELRWRGEALTVATLRREVAITFAAAGLEEPEGNLIAPGREGAVPHNTGDPASVLHAHESLIVDLFPRRRLFADCTRTFCVGEPPPELAAAHGAVLAALSLARKRARPGVRGFAIQEEVCRHFESLGHPTLLGRPGTTSGYVHGLGHGVGFEVHELPHFRAAGEDGDGAIERGDVFTLEPGLYDPERGWAVRLEDLCHLGARGLENLTPLPYDLDPRAWPLDGG